MEETMLALRVKTYMDDKCRPWGIMYRAGGNPPIAAGIFDQDGERMAWWPASVPATEANIGRVVQELIWTRENDEPVSRKAIRNLLS